METSQRKQLTLMLLGIAKGSRKKDRSEVEISPILISVVL